MINRVKLLGFAVSGNLDTHVLTATPYSTNDQVSQYEEVILEVLAEGFDEARSIKLNFTLPDDSTVEDIHMKPIGNNKFQVRLNDVIGNKLTVGTTQTVNVEIIVYTRSGYARTETPVSYQLYKTSLDTTYHPTDMDVAFIAINQLISDTSGSDGSVSEIKDKIDRIIDGSTVVGRANADADGNVFSEKYVVKEELPTKLSQFTNDGDGNKPFITSAALANYATKSELPADYISKGEINNLVENSKNTAVSTANKYTNEQLRNYVTTNTLNAANYLTNTKFDEYKNQHNTEYTSLNEKVNHFLDVDDTTKDQLSEVLKLIESGGSGEVLKELANKADKSSVYTKEQTNTEIINAVESAYGTVLEIGINDGVLVGDELLFSYAGTFKNNTRYFLSLHAPLITRTGDLPGNLGFYIIDSESNKIGITCISQPDITKTATTMDLSQIERQDATTGFYWYAMAIYRNTSDGKTFYIDTINCEQYSVLTGEELTTELANATIKPGQYVFATTDSGAIRKGHTYRINGDITSGTLEVHEEDVSGVFGGEAVQIKYGESGTLTAAQLLKLQQNTDNYIITTDDNQHYEIFRLSTEASKSGYRTYSCIEYENSKPIIRTITITESVRAWVMKSTEVGSGTGSTPAEITIDKTVVAGSTNAVSGGAVYTAIDNATNSLNTIITNKTDAITNSLATVATSGSYNDLKNKPVIPSLLGYATEAFVKDKINTVENKIPNVSGFATKTELNTKATEIEAKIPTVDGLASRDELNNAIAGVEAKIPNISGYATEAYVNTKLTAVYKYCGSVKTKASLPSNANIGDVYNVETDGMNYAWDGTVWDSLGSTSIDVSTKQDVLVSGSNIKSINGESILGPGNINVLTEHQSLAGYAKIENVPTKVSQLTNDESYATQDWVTENFSTTGGAGIDDTSISTTTTYSSKKIEDTFLQAPDNILQIKGASPVVRIINDGLNDSTELTGDKITFYDNTDNRTVSITPVYAADTKDGYISVNGYKLARDVDLAKKLDKTGGNVDSLTINSKAVATQEWVEGKSYLTSTSLNGYATETWVENKNYLTAHQSLAGYATEDWVNGKNYLTMASLDGYAKTSEIPTKVSQLTDASSYATTEYVDNKVSSVYRYRNSVANKDALPKTGNMTGDVYNLEDTGMNVAWNGTSWDELGSTVDLAPYALKTDIPTKVSQLTNDKNYLTAVPTEYAKKSDIPAKVSEFKNDAGYLTSTALQGYAKTTDIPSLEPYATKAYVDEKIEGASKVTFVTWED